MSTRDIDSVVIVGGGTAGWLAAAVLSRALGPGVAITLIESAEIGTVGVGEATIPQIRHLHAYLGVDEVRFLAATGGTYKLGISFEGWGGEGASYLHAFGTLGLPLSLAPFHHAVLRASEAGEPGDVWDYSLTAQAARRGRYGPNERVGDTKIGGVTSAYHLDAGRYGALLREVAEAAGVTRLEGRVVDVAMAEDGSVEAVRLEGDRSVRGQLFLDCSGFASLLLGGARGVPFEDWSADLPCDRAVAVQSAPGPSLRPYTQAVARKAGWQWRIPLRERVGNGHVFSSAHLSEDEATATLLASLEGEALGEPRLLRFGTGRRREAWSGNVVALGLAAGFLEPLESTSIHLVQSGVERLVACFPSRAMEPALRDAFNERTRREWESVRDFLVLHYHRNGRTGQAFWDERRHAHIPAGLAERLALFEAGGRVLPEDGALFAEPAFVQVMLGQGVRPRGWAPAMNALPEARLFRLLKSVRDAVAGTAESLPTHEAALRLDPGTRSSRADMPVLVQGGRHAS